jgi:hypothetical protein
MQPGINYGTNPSGLYGNLHAYDGSVCPDGSDNPSICDPAVHFSSSSLQAAGPAPQNQQGQQQQQQPQTPKDAQKQLQDLLGGNKPPKLPGNAEEQLHDLLPNLPQLPSLPQLPQTVNPNGTGSGSSPTDNLLNFLLGQ